MIYLDNAATSGFKPKGVEAALLYDLAHSANSGRSGHRYALDAAVKIENCREYLLSALGADGGGYAAVFTKNCTEALNLGIFGFLREGMRVVTTAFDHNSVLRPLFELEKRGKISLMVVEPAGGRITPEHLDSALADADFAALSVASNVTGARIDLDLLAESVRRSGVTLLLDRIAALRGDRPVILTGDFNADPSSTVIAHVLEDGTLRSAWDAAAVRHGAGWSFADFGQIPVGERPLIDYVFFGGGFEADECTILPDTLGGGYVSDHAPVRALLRYAE